MSKPLTQIEKVAILLISLGEDLASELIHQLPEYEAQRVLHTIAKIDHVEPEVARKIQDEFKDLLATPQPILPDGASTARRIIARAFDPDTSVRLSQSLPLETPQSFREAESVDSKTLWQLLMKEHPQTIALILAHLSPRKSSDLVASMHPSVRADVLLRLATLTDVDAEILRELDEVLIKVLASARAKKSSRDIGGPRKTAEIIALFGPDRRREILSNLENLAPNVASEVRSRLFTFEDLQKLDRSAFETLLKKIQQSDLEIALRKCPKAIAEQFYAAMSERRADQLRENIAVSKAIPIAKVQDAQQKIAKLAVDLIASGEIRDPLDEVV